MSRCIALLLICMSGLAAVERDEAWYRASYTRLAQQAALHSLPELYYKDRSFTPSHQALMQVRDPLIQDVLVGLFTSDPVDRNRWNYLMIMINRQTKRGQPDDPERILACCLAGMTAQDEWLKTEAVWGVGFYGDASHMDAVRDAKNDMSETVAEEADRTLRKLRARPLTR